MEIADRRHTADPPYWTLSSPKWDGEVTITEDQIYSIPMLITAITAQKNTYIEKKWFTKFWLGDEKAGIEPRVQLLLDDCEIIQAPGEERRDWSIGHAIYEMLDVAQKRQTPCPYGGPSELEDGSVVFSFRHIHEALSTKTIKVTSAELAKVLKKYCTYTTMEVSGKQRRIWSADGGQMTRLASWLGA
jgi:hypothetical protein